MGVGVAFMRKERGGTNVVDIRTRLGEISGGDDVVYLLNTSRDLYLGGEPFTVGQTPAFLRASIEKIQYATFKPYVSASGVIQCCLSVGLDSFMERLEARKLVGTRETYNSIEFKDAELGSSVYQILSAVDINVGGTGQERVNVRLEESLKSSMMGASKSLGIGAGTLAKIVVVDVLSKQPKVTMSLRRMLKKTLSGVLEKLSIQQVLSSALVRVLNYEQCEECKELLDINWVCCPVCRKEIER